MHQCNLNLRIGQTCRWMHAHTDEKGLVLYAWKKSPHKHSVWRLTDYWSLNLSTRGIAKGWRVKLVEGRRRTGIGVEMDNLTLFIRAPEYPISEASSVFGSFNEQAWVLSDLCHIVLHQMLYKCCTSWLSIHSFSDSSSALYASWSSWRYASPCATRP